MGRIFAGFVWLALTLFCAPPAAAGDAAPAGPWVEVSFHFKEMRVMASNQFAIWVEDARGGLVRTVFATDFTGRRGGWDFRENSLPLWVERAEVASLDEERFDAFSGATPTSGNLTYEWDLLDDRGEKAPPGVYDVFLEATCQDENGVVYKAAVNVGGAAATVVPEPSYRGENAATRVMIDKVLIRYIP